VTADTKSLCAFPALRRRFNRLYDALVLIENGCELASEDIWPYLSRIHEVATKALQEERLDLAAEMETGRDV
jgi:hypothetical protein